MVLNDEANRSTERSPLLDEKGTLGFSAVLFMFVSFALVIACCVYFAFVGWFGNLFQSKTLFTFMLLATYLPGPGIVLMQTFMDSRYTAHFGAEGAYGFRILASLAVLAMCTILMPFCTAQWQVLVVGAVIGTLARAGISTTLQLAAAVDTSFPRYVHAGSPASQVVPIILTLILKFEAESPKTTAVIYCAIPAAIILVVSMLFLLAALTVLRGVSQFRAAYNRLFEAAQQQEKVQSSGLLSTWFPCSDLVGRYYLTHTVQWFFDTLPMPFVTFAGSYDLASRLILVSFGAQIIGSFASIAGSSLLKPFGYQNVPFPMHIIVLVLQALSLVPFFAQISGLIDFGKHTSAVLLATFGLSCTLSRYVLSENAVAVLQPAPQQYHAAICRGLLLINATVQLVTVLLGWLVISLSGLSD